jgi:hypothetical protein
MEEPEPDSFFNYQRKVLITAIALVALCTQLTKIMALPSASAEKERAKWNDRETTELIQYLWEHRSEGGDGGGFKPPTFKAAAEHIAPYHTSGPVKTTKSVQTKWIGVSHSSSLYGSLLTSLHSLNQPFKLSLHTETPHLEPTGTTRRVRI